MQGVTSEILLLRDALEDGRFYIYKMRNTINGKIYVGQTEHPKNRISVWLAFLRHGSGDVPQAMRDDYAEYGEEVFVWEVLGYVSTRVESLPLEDYWIKRLRANNPQFGYNTFLNTEIKPPSRLGAVNSVESNSQRGKTLSATIAARPELRELKRQTLIKHNANPKILSDMQIKEMLELKSKGWSQMKLAEYFKVSQPLISVELRKAGVRSFTRSCGTL
jgi:group I intron endonuclease